MGTGQGLGLREWRGNAIRPGSSQAGLSPDFSRSAFQKSPPECLSRLFERGVGAEVGGSRKEKRQEAFPNNVISPNTGATQCFCFITPSPLRL